QTNSILQVTLDWSRSGYKPRQMGPLIRQVLDRLASMVGVRSATLAGMTPISGAAGSQFINVKGFTESPDDRRRVSLNTVAPMSLAANARRAVRDVLPNVPVARISTLAEQVDASILPERLIAMLSALFGALAAVLVAIGLYGLLAYTVTRRMKEIALRIAIGATSRDVIRMVLTSALGLVSAGLIVGVPIALWVKRSEEHTSE